VREAGHPGNSGKASGSALATGAPGTGVHASTGGHAEMSPCLSIISRL